MGGEIPRAATNTGPHHIYLHVHGHQGMWLKIADPKHQEQTSGWKLISCAREANLPRGFK